MLYYLLAFLIGTFIILTMVLGGNLARQVGVPNSIAVHYTVGTGVSLLMCWAMLRTLPQYQTLFHVPFPYVLGGALGIVTTFIANMVVTKVAAVYVVALRLIGQVFTGAVIDYLYFDLFSIGKVIGVAFFLLGVLYNIHMDRKTDETKQNRQGGHLCDMT